jgi:hypothetical protein
MAVLHEKIEQYYRIRTVIHKETVTTTTTTTTTKM